MHCFKGIFEVINVTRTKSIYYLLDFTIYFLSVNTYSWHTESFISCRTEKSKKIRIAQNVFLCRKDTGSTYMRPADNICSGNDKWRRNFGPFPPNIRLQFFPLLPLHRKVCVFSAGPLVQYTGGTVFRENYSH
jgi:hypothetical protein